VTALQGRFTVLTPKSKKIYKAMAITRQKKEEILGKLKQVADAPSVVFLNFKSLPVTDTTRMRSDLSENAVSYFVAKKTLVKKAFSESAIEGELPPLDGELAIAYSEDPTSAAREVYKFHKEFGAAKVQILGGVFENRFLSKVEMEEIAQIPSLDVLRGMFVNVINSPIQGFAVVLKAYADKQEA